MRRPAERSAGLLLFGAGMMRPITRTAGLSIGDRACLALANHLNVKVLTADRAWKTLGAAIGIDVELIR